MATDREVIVNRRFLFWSVVFIICIAGVFVFLDLMPKKTYYTCKQMKLAGDTSYNAALDRNHDGKSCTE